MDIGNAVEYDRYGGFDVVQVVPQERPYPGPDEVVIDVAAAGLNHIERDLREGKLRDEVELEFPVGQGVDVAGIVHAVGSEVVGIHVGDEVMGHVVGSGSHATWAKTPAGAVVRKPATVPWEVAGGLYLAGCTAKAVVDGLRLGRGDTIVVSAAAGGVGHLECQLALVAGATVIGTCSPRNHDFLRQMGVIPVTYGPGIEYRVDEAAQGRTITAFVDNHGEDESRVAEALAVPVERFVSVDDRREHEIRFLRAPGIDDEVTDSLTALGRMLEDHRIRVIISGFYPFEYIVDAYEDLAASHSRGKVVIGLQPVETGPRLTWYRSEKARTIHDA